MSKLTALSTALAALAITQPVNAMEFGKPISIKVPVKTDQRSLTGQPTFKEVAVMDVKLTKAQRKKFTTFPKQSEQRGLVRSRYPASASLGMNGTPVLDQGRHGSCVTFAVTGALDAILGKGDHVSQLCSLELGSYLEPYGYRPSGWDGSFGPWIIDQLLNYGYVSKEDQLAGKCGTSTEYPVADKDDNGAPLSLEDYKKVSTTLGDHLTYYPLLTYFERLQWDMNSTKDGDRLIERVKETISQRTKNDEKIAVTFATLLPVNHCHNGACARVNKDQDTWALTDSIKYDQKIKFGGHEMIITGYDDNAVAVDNEGKTHKGLFTLRNSWGTDAGDNGNYYITYDFFRQFADEVNILATVTDRVID